MDANDPPLDCLVIGGGAAGLSAALVLGRARKRVLVVDAGAPSNAAAHGIGGLLGHDGRAPHELSATGREELRAYPTVARQEGVVEHVEAQDESFVATLEDGSTRRATRVLLAMGLDYRPIDLPGVAERWGRSVFHCPFCHGWEVRDQRLAIVAPAAMLTHLEPMLRGWSDDVVVVDAEGDPRTAPVAITGPGADVQLADGTTIERDAVLIGTDPAQRSALHEQLGLTAGPRGVVGTDGMGRTDRPGVYAAGDVAVQGPSVAAAIASGSMAAAMVVADAAGGRAALSPAR